MPIENCETAEQMTMVLMALGSIAMNPSPPVAFVEPESLIEFGHVTGRYFPRNVNGLN
jgi:hypothetical protein